MSTTRSPNAIAVMCKCGWRGHRVKVRSAPCPDCGKLGSLSKSVNLPIGRPTAYDPKFCQMLIDFFDIEPNEHPVLGKELNEETGEMETVLGAKREPKPLPTITKFAKSIGVDRVTLLDWSKKKNEAGELVYPAFSHAYAHAKVLQKEFLIENGLLGLYNSQAFIFTAKNITDMQDVQKVEQDAPQEKVSYLFVVPSFESYEKLDKKMAVPSGNGDHESVQ